MLTSFVGDLAVLVQFGGLLPCGRLFTLRSRLPLGDLRLSARGAGGGYLGGAPMLDGLLAAPYDVVVAGPHSQQSDQNDDDDRHGHDRRDGRSTHRGSSLAYGSTQARSALTRPDQAPASSSATAAIGIAHDSAWRALSSGASKVAESSRIDTPSMPVRVPLTDAVRRRSRRAGVL